MNLNGYDLSRNWFDFCFENPEKISPSHTALYFFAIEHCNRLGWKNKFGFPTTMAMEAIGIKSYNTYIKIFTDLLEFGFIKLIQKSTNQYSSNIIALSYFNKALDKALDKALIKHDIKHHESIDSIIKQLTNKQLNKEQVSLIQNIIDFNSEKKDIPIFTPHDFYRMEIENNKNGEKIKEYEKFYDLLNGNNKSCEVLEGVLSIKNQVTYKQFCILLKKSIEKHKKFSDFLLTLDNDKKYFKTKISLSKTLHTWLNSDYK